MSAETINKLQPHRTLPSERAMRAAEALMGSWIDKPYTSKVLSDALERVAEIIDREMGTGTEPIIPENWTAEPIHRCHSCKRRVTSEGMCLECGDILIRQNKNWKSVQ